MLRSARPTIEANDDRPGGSMSRIILIIGGPEQYVTTMKRLRDLPVQVVHGGHDPSFGRDRLVEICDNFLAKAS